MYRLNKWIVLLLIAFITACAGPEHFEPLQPTATDASVLYIYRPKADNPGAQPLRYSYPDMILDEQSVGALKFNTHKQLLLEPGRHQLKVTGLTKQAKWKEKDKELEFEIQPGE